MQRTKLALIGICGIASLGLVPARAAAAPAPASLTAAIALAGTQAKQEVAYRRCWRRNGERHCRWYGSPYRGNGYGYGYSRGPTYPEAYRTGSSRWWQEMDREDRGGRGNRP